jgi:4-hydroxyphenylpyruvate dioxygenase
MLATFELPTDHPGFSDPAYRARRSHIASIGAAHRPGDPIPDVDYTKEEDEVWRIVSRQLARQHVAHACSPYLRAADRLVLPTERVPQLREVDARVRALTGFHIRPVAGLVPPRDFYGALAQRAFLSTQYVRHHSVPFYTPEPDLVHEIIGHANTLASDDFADLYTEAGRASARTTSAEGLEFFSKVFWFTLEFGVVWEDGALKAYGAGLLSSYGELQTYRRAEIRNWNLLDMGTRDYDITHYQPVLYSASSFDQLVKDLGQFLRAYDEDWYRQHVACAKQVVAPFGTSSERNAMTDTSTVTSDATTNRTVAPAPAARLLGWDCLEFWVGNARTTAGFLLSAFGFTCTSYAGPETGVRDKASYVLEQGDIRFVVSAALNADSPIAAHVRAHGDGVHDLAWLVNDARAAFEAAVERGATAVRRPWEECDEQGVLTLAQIGAYGDTVHTLVDRGRYVGPRLEPGYESDHLPPTPVGPSVGLLAIDHVVGNVEQGRLDDWVQFYAQVLGFTALQHFSEGQISTEYSALASTVVWDGKEVVMPINEPAEGRRTSQISEYLEAYDGPGVQHVALRTDDIVATVDALRARGVRFMEVPDAYYHEARRRVEGEPLPWADLQRLGILVDRDEGGTLLQIFTETITDRPAVFFEIIERRGASGFGEGNFKALFEAIERDQARRGNL